jgi:hypothetical protein
VKGTQKFSELLKKNCLKYLYKFETLVPLEVLPLRLNAAIPASLPVLRLLQTVAGGVLRGTLNFQTCTNTLNKFF